MVGEYFGARPGELAGGEQQGQSSGTIGESHRGQTAVFGFLLLVAIVGIGAVSIVMIGSSGLDAHQSASAIEHAEGSLVAFAHAAETTQTTPDAGVPVAIGPFDRGNVETRDDAGQVRLVQTTESGTEELYSDSLGTVEYTAGDTNIAYQGGGVWRSDDDGSAMVSSPTLDYRDGTLSFSIARLDGPQHSGAIDGSVHRTGSPTRIDLQEAGHRAGGPAPGELRIEIESAYCDGWARSIETTVPGTITEGCSEGADGRVQFELSVPPTIGTIDSAIIAPEVDIHSSAPPIEGDVRTNSVDEELVTGTVVDSGYDYPSIDTQIATAVDDCDGEWNNTLPAQVDEPGQYCVETIDDSHTFDTSAGDIEVVVRDSIGEPNYQDQLDVEGDNDLTIVVDGDLDARGNAVIGNDTDPSQTRLLFSDDSSVTTANGDPTIAALVYAPDSTVALQGNPTVDGSIVAQDVEIDNIRPGGVAYDDRIAGVEVAPSLELPLEYLDVTVSELSIDE